MVCDVNNVYYLFQLEQYDTFVKFSHDQVEKRLAESAFSCKFLLLLLCVIVLPLPSSYRCVLMKSFDLFMDEPP